MFGHHKVLRTGAQADAVVTAATLRTPQAGQLGTWHLDLVVVFPDGATASLSAKVSQTHIRAVSVGDRIPVRFDAADRSEVVVDTPELDVRKAARIEMARQQDAAAAQQALNAARRAAS